MKVLFYLEPSLEMPLNPLFRYPTLRNSVLPQMESLRKAGNDIFLLASKEVIDKSIVDGYSDLLGEHCSIDMLEWSSLNGYLTDSKMNTEGNGELCALVKKSIPSSFVPDVIISWESTVSFFQNIYPLAKIIYTMPGFFSRVPYPEFVSFDFGLLQNSSLPSLEGVNKEDIDSISEYRTYISRLMKTTTPVEKEISALRKKFSALVLFPMQIDGYFMIDDVLKGEHKNQLQLLISLLKMTPIDIGIVVSNYRSKDVQSGVFSDANIAYLRKTFSNFIYIESFDNVPYVSQFLAMSTHGTITISSSVGYHAAFWQKPLFAVPTSHISHFSSSASFKDFLADVAEHKSINQDEKIARLLRKSHLHVDTIKNPALFSAWLEKSIKNGAFVPVGQNESLLALLTSATRKKQFLFEMDKAKALSYSMHESYCKEAWDQIKKHDVVSFDIFDTLLYRTLKHPTDLYDLMQERVFSIVGKSDFNFKSVRKLSEKEAFLASIAREEGETTLDEIYACLAERLNIKECVAEKIKMLEMEFEEAVLRPRMSGYIAFHSALSSGKKIVLTSDMYLPESFLRAVLEKNGYVGYESFYLSSNEKLKKHSGKLYDVLLSDYPLEKHAILHVGDNLEADVIKAKERKIKAFHLPKTYDVFTSNTLYKSLWAKDEQRHDAGWGSVMSIIAEKLHSNPYFARHQRSLFGGSLPVFGFAGFGPLLLGYTKWLIETSIADGIKELFFLSRDGKIMKEAYDILSKNYTNAPSSSYLLCSRRAVNVAKLKSVSDILDLFHVDFAKNTLRHLLENRFGILEKSIPDGLLKKHKLNLDARYSMDDKAIIEPLLIDLKDVILGSATIEREAYLSYLDKMGYTNTLNKKAIVDIGYAGTMQESLFKLTEQKIPAGGYYLITFRAAKKRVAGNGLFAKGYLADFIDRHDTYHPFCKHVPLYETLFSGTDTSFVKMCLFKDKTLFPVYLDSFSSEAKREESVRVIQSSALEFVSEFSSSMGKIIDTIDLEPNKSMRNLIRFFDEPSGLDARMFSGVVFEDAYGGAGLKTILPELSTIQTTDCVWKAGKEAVLKMGAQVNNPASTTINNKPMVQNQPIALKAAKLVLNQHKFKKLRDNPKMFFEDSKNPIVWLLKPLYVKEGV